MDHGMNFKPLEKKALLDFIYDTISVYTDALLRYQEYTDPQKARQAAKQEALELIPNFVVPDNHVIYAIELKGVRVGSLWYIIKQGKLGHAHAFLNYMHIETPYRQRGFATEAMKLYEAEIKTRFHCHSTDLYVFKDNVAAVTLYQKCGYLADRIEKDSGYRQRMLKNFKPTLSSLAE